MSNASSIQILYRRRTCVSTGNPTLDPATWDAAGVGVAIVGGKRDRKPVARGSTAYRRLLLPMAHGDLAPSQASETPLLRPSSRSSNCFALGQDRNRGFVFEFPEKIVGDSFEKFALDGAIAPASSSQSLENPHRGHR